MPAGRLAGSEPDQRGKTVARLKKMALPVAGFALGAGTGGLGFLSVGFLAVALPMASVLTVMIALSRRP